MKPKIEIVANMLLRQEKEILKNAINNMDGWDVDSSRLGLVKWLYEVYNDKRAINTEYFKDHFVLNNYKKTIYPDFFKFCPEVSDVFKLIGDKIVFNPLLSREEINELMKYVGTRYKPNILFKGPQRD
ncbi:hypothetical protein GCM10023210_27700 [Chryseobacterium ginsengisoli]|uniref:Uncharacterized protein n=1 Tax=Chryseobacterium ginsengisoli TaxID=363853 RepID=A0ABP9MG60_9FLAO